MKRALLIAALVFCWTRASAQILYVPSPQYTTIQPAIDDANDGDTIIVSPGTYQENIDFLGRAVTLRSDDPNDPNIVATTIIDGSDPNDPNIASVVTFANNEDANSVLTGFTIQNGSGQTDQTVTWRSWTGNNGDGGGAFCRNASPDITKNIFKNCSAQYGGGAIFCHDNASPTITHNTFINNYAGWYGAAIFARINCSPTISNNTFKQNQCKYLGGAIYLANQCYPEITNNWLEKNNCEILHAGAIYAMSSSPIIACNFFIANTTSGSQSGVTGAAILIEANTAGKIINNLFTANACTNSAGAAIAFGSNSTDVFANNIVYDNGDTGIVTYAPAAPVIYNNDVWNNTGGNYGGNLTDQTGINGNISADPNVGPELPEPFTVLELHPNSPCIDAGDNTSLPAWLTSDYDQTTRIVNTTVDIGPQEYNATAVPQDFGTIQQAINAAQSGDEIVVMPGFYQENLDFLNKNIRLRSTNPLDPNCVAKTIIDGNQLNSCIKILSGQDDSTAVAGLRLQNGHGEFGGGIHVGNSIGPITMYNYITKNTADRYGGGVDYRSNAYGKVTNNTIINNFASVAGGGVHIGPGSSCLITKNKIFKNVTDGEAGGGIYSYDSTTAWIIDNQIIANKALRADGGGIWQWGSQGGVIERNLIINNISTNPSPVGGDGGRGGGIGIRSGNTSIKNNIICGNKADRTGGGVFIELLGTNYKVVNNTIVANIARTNGAAIATSGQVIAPIINNIFANNGPGGGIYVAPNPNYPPDPNLIANNFWENQDANYIGDINDLTGTNSNISVDPCFIDLGYWDPNGTPDTNDDYWVLGDYHIGYFSLCRDAGTSQYTPQDDFDENTRPHFDATDIGAYELQFYDLTRTGSVDFTDIKMLTDYWLNQGPSIPVDLDPDALIDFRDYALLANDWFK